jgi:hypothetical protein
VDSRITLGTIPSTPRYRLDQFHRIELDLSQSSTWSRSVCWRWIYRRRRSVRGPSLRAIPIEPARRDRVARLRFSRSLLAVFVWGYRLSLGPHVRWSVCHLTSIDESGGELTRLSISVEWHSARRFPDINVRFMTLAQKRCLHHTILAS